MDARLRAPTALDPADGASVIALVARARAVDGVSAVSEEGLLSLPRVTEGLTHVLAYAGERLTGYAQVRPDGSAELVVDPAARRLGLGRALLARARALRPTARFWAHGDLPAGRALAHAAGLERVRELYRMGRAVRPEDSAEVELPEPFRVRAFVPGADDEAWVALNAASFADHPEQGRMTVADLHERMAQPWFEAAGLLLVEDSRTGGLAAFHWTKVDPSEGSPPEPVPPGPPVAATRPEVVGEVYALGVHPAYQGRGLARPLTRLGLAHLARRGVTEVVLYVDGDNAAARRTYAAEGFSDVAVDVMYAAAPVVNG